MTRRFILVLFAFISQSLVFADSISLPEVSFHSGKCYLQLKRDKVPKPSILETNQTISALPPYALVTSKDSFLEVKRGSKESQTLLRLGRATALEFQINGSYFFIKYTSYIFFTAYKIRYIFFFNNSIFYS